MIRRTWIARLFLAALAVTAVASPARAGLLPVSVSVQSEAGNFRWTYSIVLPTDMKLQAGDYFTIYDFGGFVPGTANVSSTSPDASYAANWNFSTDLVGPTPAYLDPGDDPAVGNLTWKYNGPTIPSGQLTLGNFATTSLFEQSQASFFTATNLRAAGGDIDSNITATISPTGQVIPPTPGVPEPTTLALAGLGLPFLGAARWLRRRKNAV